jgi:hypothetical protein
LKVKTITKNAMTVLVDDRMLLMTNKLERNINAWNLSR